MRKPGGIFIADEVQPGFGGLSTHVRGFARHRLFARHGRQAHGQRPSGLARRLLRPDVIESLGKRIRYFNTFGGNPVSCARVHAVLKAIKAGRQLVLISATGHEGQILKTLPAAGILAEEC
jgi:4-aminobutyrate aminotransferase-like enzyme